MMGKLIYGSKRKGLEIMWSIASGIKLEMPLWGSSSRKPGSAKEILIRDSMSTMLRRVLKKLRANYRSMLIRRPLSSNFSYWRSHSNMKYKNISVRSSFPINSITYSPNAYRNSFKKLTTQFSYRK